MTHQTRLTHAQCRREASARPSVGPTWGLSFVPHAGSGANSETARAFPRGPGAIAGAFALISGDPYLFCSTVGSAAARPLCSAMEWVWAQGGAALGAVRRAGAFLGQYGSAAAPPAPLCCVPVCARARV